MSNDVMTTKSDVMDIFHELGEGTIIVQETDDYVIKRLNDGTFKKEMKYKQYMSHVPETEEEQIQLYKVLNSNGENKDIIELKNMVGKEINVEQVYTMPYESFDEKTGESKNGVSIIMKDGEKWFATSSKSVYFALLNFFKTFGYPNTGKYKTVVFSVVGIRRENGTQISLSLESIKK